MVPDVDSDEGEEVAEDFDSRVEVEQQLERAADRGKGAFLLCTFKEVFDRIIPTAAGLREAYDDALHFKCACTACCLKVFRHGRRSFSLHTRFFLSFSPFAPSFPISALPCLLPLPPLSAPSFKRATWCSLSASKKTVQWIPKQ